jgi:pyridoxal biosynthesis lyase PdxS
MAAMTELGTMRVKSGLAEMLKGGVIMDVTTAEQARIAEEAGAVAVMALERVPADIRAQGGVARMADPHKIQEIKDTVTIPDAVQQRLADAGADARAVGFELARQLTEDARARAAGIYVIPPFKEPDAALELLTA